MRFILFPFSFLYGLVLEVRNVLFDLGILNSYKPKVKTIAVGNLNTGGTGKTPFTELLIRNFIGNRKIAVISRGYGRSTKGFLWVNKTSDPIEVGDEPLQIKQKHPSIMVCVCEKRKDAIQKIEQEHKEIDLIILDDAFQHRSVTAHVYILLTTYRKPYFEDSVLPGGRLREWRKGARRADILVMTKCPNDLSQFDTNALKLKFKAKAYQKIFFATEKYQSPYSLLNYEKVKPEFEYALIVSGIANNVSFTKYLSEFFENIDVFKLPDHVEYDLKAVERIVSRYDSMNKSMLSCIVTTEKDAVKLRAFSAELENIPVLVLPYEHSIRDFDVFASTLEEEIMR